MSQIADKPRNCDKRGGILVVKVPGLVFPLSCTHITLLTRIWSRVREGTFTVEGRWRTKRFMSMNRKSFVREVEGTHFGLSNRGANQSPQINLCGSGINLWI